MAEAGVTSEALATELGATIRGVLKLNGRVSFVDPGSLPNDGKVIVDERKYD
jgi:phenylacetate-CoA ligase